MTNQAQIDQAFAAFLEISENLAKAYLKMVENGVPADHALLLTQTMVAGIILQAGKQK